jgi:hypothetical protein
VITVGASDTNNTGWTSTDDTAAPWSAFGYTLDGFSKPDLGAPGRSLVGPPNPNLGLNQYVGSDGTGGVAFDSASWASSATANASWNQASWNQASWNQASWASASWNAASWNQASWNQASWSSASWNAASWAAASWAA